MEKVKTDSAEFQPSLGALATVGFKKNKTSKNKAFVLSLPSVLEAEFAVLTVLHRFLLLVSLQNKNNSVLSLCNNCLSSY